MVRLKDIRFRLEEIRISFVEGNRIGVGRN
jgi:hypothetical protein